MLLTARNVEGEWLTDIIEALDSDRTPIGRARSLPDQHPDGVDVYRHTVAALATGPVDPPPVPRGNPVDDPGLCAAGLDRRPGTAALPTTPGALYDEVLRHEENYWAQVFPDFDSTAKPDRALLRRAAACVTLLSPTSDEAANQALSRGSGSHHQQTLRRAVRRTLAACLEPAPGDGLAVRPNPVGDHLLLRELAKNPELLGRAVDGLGEQGDLRPAFTVLNRAGRNDSPPHPRIWHPSSKLNQPAGGNCWRWPPGRPAARWPRWSAWPARPVVPCRSTRSPTKCRHRRSVSTPSAWRSTGAGWSLPARPARRTRWWRRC